MEMINDLCATCRSKGMDKCDTDFEKIQLDDITRNVVACDNYKEKPKHHLKITYECDDKIAVVEEDVYELPKVKWKKEKQGIGEFKNVFIAPEDLEKLKSKYPREYSDAIEALSRYIEIEPKKAKRYKNHYAVVCQWITRELKRKKAREKEIREREERRESARKGKLQSKPSYDLKKVMADAMDNTDIC